MEITKKRLTTVIAGAGYGKTTFIAGVSKCSGLDTVWYRLDKSDRDFTTFLSYLIAGIKKYFPELGIETLCRIEEAQILSLERRAVLTVFLNEIEKFVKNGLIIVLDDYHLIRESQEINESLEFLLQHLPLQVHLVIISRTDPGLHLSRFRATRELLEIREEELAFTIPEIEQLYLELFLASFPPESIKILHKRTSGWISGLILFYHFLHGKRHNEIERILIGIKGSHSVISSYLEENVFDLQPDKIKGFLIKTSILSRMNAEFSDELLGISNSRDILNALEENHLFTFPYDEERQWYFYHHLFQEFLNAKLHKELGRKAILVLHRDAGLLWEEQGEYEEALVHYLNAEEFEEACRLLRQLGKKLLKEGRLQLISSYIDKIPNSYLDKEPWLQYTHARCMEFSGKQEEAIQAYKKAHNIFRKDKSSKGTGLCQHALGHNYFHAGDFPRAEEVLQELLKHDEGNLNLRINILGSLIFITSVLGEMTVADRYFNEGMSLLSGLKNKDLLAWLYFNQGFRYGFSGDFIQALELGEKTKEMCENLGNYHLLAVSYHLISWSCYYLGLFSKGLENAGKGLDLVKERGFQDHSLGWLLMDAAFNATGLEKLTEAINNGEESLRIFEDLGSRWGQAYVCHVLHGAYTKLGDHLAAEKCAKTGIAVIEDMKLPLNEGLLKGSLAESLIERRQWEDARHLLEDAERNLRNSRLFLTRIYFLYARFYYEQKQKESALAKLLSGLRLCESNQHDVWVVPERRWIMPLLVDIFAQGEMQDYLLTIFKKMGLSGQERLALLQSSKNPQIRKAALTILDEMPKPPAPGLRVYCLGNFRVFRGDEEIPAERWKSKKAKMLFKYLVHVRSRGYLPKDVLIELLWPEGNPTKTVSRLHAVLPSLRKTLEPEISRGIPSSYLLREGDSYKLHLGDGGWVDVDEFRKESKLAEEEKNPEKSISYYLNAEAIYRGDFLEDDIYFDWCIEEREKLKEEYLDLLAKITKYYERKSDYSRCIEYARKYLSVDKYAENIYQQLMAYYSLMGNKAMLVKTFQKCKENIIEDLDSPLSKETEILYEKLKSL
jgi:two-component SAPR family response regulator